VKTVQYVVFRYLTHADFFNMYKPAGTELGGGGQSYIDFSVGGVSPKDWQSFFASVPSIMRSRGPGWKPKINSMGLKGSQVVTLYQRRAQTFAVAAQKITSGQSNRILAWHPQNGFPQPRDRTNRISCPPKLAIYIVRSDKGEFWAGWFQNSSPCRDQTAFTLLQAMLPNSPAEGHAGFIAPTSTLYIDESDGVTPFFTVPTQAAISRKPRVPKTEKRRLQRKSRSEEEITKSLFEEDESYTSEAEETVKEVIRKVRSRNTRAVKSLKELYQGKCQIMGDKQSFIKTDGARYCEAHHLIPLGDAGADSPYNIVILSPLIHRMLHYANVSEVDLAKISADNTLDIVINGETYTIKWHPEHARYVKRHHEADSS